MLQSKPRDYALFVIGTRTNLRASDLLSLRFGHVVEPDGSVSDRLSIREKKTGRIKHIALQSIARKAIQALLPKDEAVDMDAYLFQSRKINKFGDYKLSVPTLHSLVNKWTRQAKLKGNYGSHTLRKTFALRALNLGYPIQTVMLLLNHSSIASTLRYCGITREQIENATLRVTF
jgi:integrase